jgi:hypothetical protein
MEVIKKYLFGIVLLLIVAIVWAGMLFISNRSYSTINPNAASYTKPLNTSFDIETVKKIQERTVKSFPVLPSEFFGLKSD